MSELDSQVSQQPMNQNQKNRQDDFGLKIRTPKNLLNYHYLEGEMYIKFYEVIMSH